MPLKNPPIQTAKIKKITNINNDVPMPPRTIWKCPFSLEDMTSAAVFPTKLCFAEEHTTPYAFPRLTPHV